MFGYISENTLFNGIINEQILLFLLLFKLLIDSYNDIRVEILLSNISAKIKKSS